MRQAGLGQRGWAWQQHAAAGPARAAHLSCAPAVADLQAGGARSAAGCHMHACLPQLSRWQPGPQHGAHQASRRPPPCRSLAHAARDLQPHKHARIPPDPCRHTPLGFPGPYHPPTHLRRPQVRLHDAPLAQGVDYGAARGVERIAHGGVAVDHPAVPPHVAVVVFKVVHAWLCVCVVVVVVVVGWGWGGGRCERERDGGG